MFEAEQLARSTDPAVRGRSCPASEATMFEDLQVLSRAYAKEKPQIRYQKKPVYTMVATSSRGLFMGDVVEKKNPGRKHLQIRKGQWVVKVAIPYRMQAALPAEGCPSAQAVLSGLAAGSAIYICIVAGPGGLSLPSALFPQVGQDGDGAVVLPGTESEGIKKRSSSGGCCWMTFFMQKRKEIWSWETNVGLKVVSLPSSAPTA